MSVSSALCLWHCQGTVSLPLSKEERHQVYTGCAVYTQLPMDGNRKTPPPPRASSLLLTRLLTRGSSWATPGPFQRGSTGLGL